MIFEWLIARRSARDSISQNRVLVVSKAAIAVSISVMIITVAVVFGFRNQMSRLIGSITSDFVVCDPESFRSPSQAPILRHPAFEKELESIADFKTAPFATVQGLLRTEENALPVLLRGINEKYDFSFIKSHISSGELPKLDNQRRKEIVLTSSAALSLGVTAGDRVEFLTTEDGSFSKDLFRVGAIVDFSMEYSGVVIALTDMRNVQKIAGWNSNQISGYLLWNDSHFITSAQYEELNNSILNFDCDDDIVAFSAEEIYPNIHGWLGTHDINARVILSIMFLVALFNVVILMLIVVLDQTKSIGIYKTMGMTNWSIQKIFIFKMFPVMRSGLLWGNIAGISLCLLQSNLHIISLDASSYFVSYVPIMLSFFHLLVINITFVVLMGIALCLTTTIVSKIKPSTAVKHE